MKHYFKPCPGDPLRPFAWLLLATLAAAFSGPVAVLFILYPKLLAVLINLVCLCALLRIMAKLFGDMRALNRQLTEMRRTASLDLRNQANA